MASHDSEIFIIGAGIFGTSTAYHLSLNHPNPSKITVLDRAPAPCPLAASADINKIVRADYSKRFYVDLAYEAMDWWTKDELFKPYFHQTGWVMLDEKDSDLAERIRKNLAEAGRPDNSADISLDEVKAKWSGTLSDIDTENYGKAYTNADAGWADASGAVKAVMDAAIAKGIKYEVGEVTQLVHDGDRVSVKTKGNTYTADSVLLTTGAWTPWLMHDLERTLNLPAENRISSQIQAAGVCVGSFKLSEDEAAYYGQMPVLIYGAQGEVMPPNKDRMFKFTNANTFWNMKKHISGDEISTPEHNQAAISDKLKAESIEIIRQRVPKMLEDGREPDEWRTCWDAISSDQNQLICKHPDSRLSNLYFATAGSFHSWKFLPIIGKYVVNVLNGKSNGSEKDAAWQWKTSFDARGAHEKVKPRRDLADLT
jgi:sarcosine oxidase / L-pipecolate oxidase